MPAGMPAGVSFPIIMRTRTGKFIRSGLFMALGVFFLLYALGMPASGYQTAFYAFAALDIIWAVCLLVSALRNH